MIHATKSSYHVLLVMLRTQDSLIIFLVQILRNFKAKQYQYFTLLLTLSSYIKAFYLLIFEQLSIQSVMNRPNRISS